MNKKLFSIAVVVILTSCSVVAQKDPATSTGDFKNLIGCWQGTLNYSGTLISKPFSTNAELVVKQIGLSDAFEFVHIYTKNPDENVADTMIISKDGKELNNGIIKSKRLTAYGNEIITEHSGFDRDNNKAAIIRHTYTIGKDFYSYKKHVQIEGQPEWLDRQEFKYTRKACKE